MTAAAALLRPDTGALGIHAVTAAAPDSYKKKSGGGNLMRGTVHDPAHRRRDQLQRTAAGLMNDKVPRFNRAGDEVAHYVYRVAMCGRGIAAEGAVTLYRSPDRLHAEFRGVQTCGSPWQCPCCSPKIAARQVKLIRLGFDRWFDRAAPLVSPDGTAYTTRALYFLTFTNQHDAERAGQGQCKAALDLQAKAFRWFKGNRSYRSFIECAGSPGSIRGLETSYGELNGWHHHAHEILFAASGQLVTDRKGQPVRWLSPLFRLRKPWARALIKFGMAGLKPGDIGAEKIRKLRHLLTRCFDARDGSYAAEYLVKLGKEPERARGRWGIASELAKSHLKGGARDDGPPQRCDHADPWALLNDAHDGDARSGELWREFAKAFHGRAKLYWSPGLKALLGVPDISDIDLARAPDARCTVPVIILAPLQWRVVLAHDARFEVRRQGALNDRDGVLQLLQWLEKSKPSHSGEFTIVDRWKLPGQDFFLYRTPDGATHQYWGH